MQKESQFACVMTAIEPDRRESHLENARYWFPRVIEIKELDNGYAFRLADQPVLLEKLAAFVELERLCCPFFGFAIIVKPENSALWLELTGRDGVKPFIRAEISEFLTATRAFPGL